MTEAAQKTRYTTVAIVLHWVIAAALVFQILLGFRMDDLKGPQGYSAIQLHKSVGVTILLLSLARLAWRLVHRAPPSPVHSPAWERLAAKAVHAAFYVVMVGVPLSGWAMVSASRLGIPTVLYGVIPWPHLPGLPGLPAAQKEAVASAAGGAHELLAFATVALLVLHLGAVFKHQFLDRDEVLTHMAPGARPGRWAEPRLWGPLAGIVAIAVLVFTLFAPRQAAPPPAEAELVDPPATSVPAPAAPAAQFAETPETAASVAEESAAPVEPSVWTVQKGGTLSFEASWSGSPIGGSFKDWSADILFDPEALDRSKVKVTIDVSSAVTGDAARDSALPGNDWFDAGAHPKATFTATRFRKTGTDRYVADGRLSLRGASRPLSLPFTLKIDGDTARASGTATLDRTAFGVGQGSWAATDQIAGAVKVAFDLTAKRK